MNPHIIRCIQKGYNEKLKQQDYLAWVFGNYTLSAVLVGTEHVLSGKQAKSKYIEKPVLKEALEDSLLTPEEIEEREMQKEIAAMEKWIENDRRIGLPETTLL